MRKILTLRLVCKGYFYVMAETLPWRAYEQKLASFVQAMQNDQMRTVSVTDVNGTSLTYSSLESLMKAYKIARQQAEEEEAAAARAGAAWGPIKLTRNGV